jgi:hypothetical protein
MEEKNIVHFIVAEMVCANETMIAALLQTI